jgi:ABC-type transport system substrate-binding protein
VKDFICLEIDEMPLGISNANALDYMGRYVSAAAVEPLLRFDDKSGRVVPGLLTEPCIERDGLRHRFRVESNRAWSNGEALDAVQIAASLRQTRAQRPYWAHHLRSVHTIEGRGDMLTVELRKPLRHLAALFTSQALAPTCGETWRPNSPVLGPYVLEGVDLPGAGIRYVANPFFPGAKERAPLHFQVQKDVESVPERFCRHLIDVTCSTMFPLTTLGQWSGRSEYRSGPAPVWMQLEFTSNAHPILMKRDVREQLSAAIDRNALSAALCGGVLPRWSVLATTARLEPGLQPPTPYAGTSDRISDAPSELRLAFCDYYPNYQVAKFVADSWAQYLDLKVSLVSVPFGTTSPANADISLVLRLPVFPDPISELEAALVMLGCVGSPDEFRRARTIVIALQHQAGAPSDSDLRDLVHILDRSVPVIPLLDLRHHWLTSARVSNFDLPCLGSFDYSLLRLT